MIIVGVAGGSCSGKTSYITKASEVLGEDRSAVLSQDNYYHDQSDKFDRDGGAINFDHPDALDLDLLTEHLRQLKAGQDIQVPIYDFATHKRQKETNLLKAKDVIFVDGILIFTHQGILEQLDHSVFIECDESLRLQRRVTRDTTERGRSEQGVRDQFSNQVVPMHDQFVEKSKSHAQLVLSQEEYLEDYTNSCQKLLSLIKQPS